jgi:hypothetical protein
MAMALDPSIELASVILGTLVFASAAAGKLRHIDEFSGVVANYRLLPQWLASPAAIVIVLLESFVVVSLVSGLWLLAGAVVAIALLGLFAIAMAINLSRGRTFIDCGCFQSTLKQQLSGALVVRNIVLTVALVPTLLSALAHSPSLPGRLWNAPSFLAAMDGVAAGIALYLIYQAFGLIITLRDLAAALHKRFV